MRHFLLLILALIAIAMIVLGARAHVIPPVLTGIGFLVIVALHYNKDK